MVRIKVAECALVTGDFAIAGADGAAQVLTATLTGKSMGNALLGVADGTNMHLAFVKTGTSVRIGIKEAATNAYNFVTIAPLQNIKIAIFATCINFTLF